MVETRTTYCRICEALCGLTVDVESGRATAIRPDPEHVASRGFACVKGTKFLDVHRDPDRLRHPLRKVDGRWERTTWDEANARIGSELSRIRRKYGPHAIGLYFGNPTAFSMASPIASQGFVRGLGTRNVFSAGSQDCNEKFAVARRMYGSSLLQPIPDFASNRFLLLLGTNPAVSQMSFVHAPRPMDKLRAITERGGRVVVLDPRRTETASAPHVEHHFIRPDTDAFLLAAIAKRVVDRGFIDRSVVDRHTRGFDALAAAVRGVDVAGVARITGVDEALIDDLAQALATTEGAAIHVSTGVSQGSGGLVAFYLAQALMAITGNLDRRGGVLVGEHLLPLDAWLSHTDFDDSPHRSRIGGFEPVMGTLPATILADEILTPGEGQIRALIVVAGNPLLSCANPDRLAEAFGQLELLVSIDLYRNETAEIGTDALPALDFLERPDFPFAFLALQPEPYLQWTDAVTEPLGESRDELRVFVDLCRKSKIRFFGVPGLAEALEAARRIASHPMAPGVDLMLRRIGLDLKTLRAAPHGLQRKPLQPGTFLGKRVLTRDRRVDLAPPALVEALRELGSAVRERAASVDGQESLLLFSKREKTSHNSWMHNVRGLVKGPRGTNYAYLNPGDAERRGITDGDRVSVTSDAGTIVLPARLDPDVMPGAIAIPHGWGHEGAVSLQVARGTSGQNVNRLAADGVTATERVSGMTRLIGIPVRVSKPAPG